MSWVVAIPSYNRPKELAKKTLACLKNGKVPASKIFVFVVKDQLEEYQSIVPKELYNKMIVGVKGLIPQRQFINDYFKKGQDIVCMDDDVRALKHLTKSTADKTGNKIEDVSDMNKFFDMAFKVMKEKGANIWGMSATANAFYMNEKITTDLRYIVGAFYGIHNTKDPQLKLRIGNGGQEDKERTVRYFDRDGVVVRFNAYAPVTTYFAPGGLDTPTRKAETKQETELLMKAFPKYFVPVYKPARGIYDLKFKIGADTKARKSSVGATPTNPALEGGMPRRAEADKPPKNIISEEDRTDDSIEKLTIRNKAKYEEAKIKLLEELAKITVPKISKPSTTTSTNRGNVIGTIGRTVTMGFGDNRRGFNHFKTNEKYPEVFKALVNFGNLVVPKGWEYQTITLNHNAKAKKHVDSKNVGKSVIIGIGDFTGGEIRVFKPDGTGGKDYNLHDIPLLFNGGLLPHETQEFKVGDYKPGEGRYTMIFYKQGRKPKSPVGVGSGRTTGLNQPRDPDGVF
jgi:hypothetical protein